MSTPVPGGDFIASRDAVVRLWRVLAELLHDDLYVSEGRRGDDKQKFGW